MQLQDYVQEFRDAGIAVAAITYDAPELQARFVAKAGIDYPVLSDVDAASMKALGILNEDYQPGDSAYGIPHPGIFIADRRGVVREKIFIRGYDTRMHAQNVLEVARTTLGME